MDTSDEWIRTRSGIQERRYAEPGQGSTDLGVMASRAALADAGLAPEKVPHNIERYGNTTAATLPILFHECRQQGLVRPGGLVAFTALGSGLHWGAALYRA